MTCSTSEGCEEKTINILKSHNIKYYMTKDGPIKVKSDGNSIKISH
jgi:hypothetical protein